MLRFTLIASALLAPALTWASPPDRDWPQWRGPQGTGAAPDAKPPLEWTETKNIRWKVELPGRGHATPIIWGELIYVQTAIKTDQAKAAPVENSGGRPDGGGGGGERFEMAPQDRPERPDGPPRQDRPRRQRGPRAAKPTQVHEFTVLALDRKNGQNS